MRMPLFLFNDQCDVIDRGVNGRGEPVDEVIASGTPCRIEPNTANIKGADGSTIVSRAKAMFPSDTQIESGYVVIHNGIEYDVLDAAPIPSLIGYSHKEATLG